MNTHDLKQLRLFSNLKPSQLEELAGLCRSETIGAGSWLFHEGDKAEAMIGVLEGRIKVVKTSSSGREAILEVFGPGDTFAEVPAIDCGTYPASACAMEPAHVVWINAAGLRQLLERDTKLAIQIIRELAGLLRTTTRRIKALQTERVEPRVANLLLQLSKRLGEPTERGVILSGKWTRQDLADLVGATQETVIRILSRWQKAGWIESGARIEILDMQALIDARDELED